MKDKIFVERCLQCGKPKERDKSYVLSQRAWGAPMKTFCDKICSVEYRRKHRAGGW